MGVRIKRVRTLIFIGLALALAGCGSSSHSGGSSSSAGGGSSSVSTGSSAPPTPIKVKVSSAAAFAVLDQTVAKWAGYFQQEGLDVSWGPTGLSSADAANAALTGYDISSTTGAGLIPAAGSGRGIVGFGVSAQRATAIFVLRKDVADKLAAQGVTPTSPVKARIAALKGLTLATSSAGGSTEVLLRQAIAYEGFDPTTFVKFVVVSATASVGALNAKQIDGYMLSPPTPILSIAAGAGVQWLSAPVDDIPSWKSGIYTMFVTSTSFASSNPEALTRWNKAVSRAADLIKSDPSAAAAFAAKEFPDDTLDVLTQSIKAIAGSFVGPQATTQLVQEQIDSYNSTAGVTKVTITPSALWWSNDLK